MCLVDCFRSSRMVRVTLCVWPSGKHGRIQQETLQFIYSRAEQQSINYLENVKFL